MEALGVNAQSLSGTINAPLLSTVLQYFLWFLPLNPKPRLTKVFEEICSEDGCR